MSFHKLLLKISYWLVAISIVVIILLTFFGQRIIKQASEEAAKQDGAVAEETTNVEMSGITIIRDESKVKKDTVEDEGQEKEETEPKIIVD